MSRVLPAIAVLVAAAVVLVVSGVDAWRSATAHGWLEDGYYRLVRQAFWHRFDRTAPPALGVLTVLLLAWLVVRRQTPPRAALAVPVVVIALMLSARSSAFFDGARGRRPNVLLVSIDTLRPDRLGTHGYPRPTSPVVDARLAAGGVVFENAWSQSPKTTPSHMTMLTSLYPAVHGIGLWMGSGAAPALNPRVHTLAEILKDAGYATAAFTAGAHMHRDRGFAQGFDVYKHGSQLERTLEYLADPPRTPFFLFFHTYEVHDPYAPPADVARAFATDPVEAITAAVEEIRSGSRGWNQGHKRFWAAVDGRDPRHVRYVSDLYDAGIRRMDDRTLTRILDALDHHGLAGDTLVVFTSDHGEAFHEHGRFLHDDLYPETLRVPLVLRLPGRLPAGRRVAEAVGLVDLMPTILELAGLSGPTQTQGTSLAPLARGDARATAPTAVLADYTTAGHRFESVRRDGLALIRENDQVRVYDRTADPGERTPLGPEAAARGTALGAELDRWHAANAALAARLGPRSTDVSAPSAATVEQLRALGYVE